MEKFIVNGKINSRYIENKVFTSNAKALEYIDQLCSKYDLQVEEIINDDLKNTFVIDYHNQFSINQIAM
jgi:hypothetical protein